MRWPVVSLFLRNTATFITMRCSFFFKTTTVVNIHFVTYKTNVTFYAFLCLVFTSWVVCQCFFKRCLINDVRSIFVFYVFIIIAIIIVTTILIILSVRAKHMRGASLLLRLFIIAFIEYSLKSVGSSRFTTVCVRARGGNGSKMAALKEEQCYGLSCGRVSNGSNVSVFHVKLTDSALRAFEGYQSSKVNGSFP